MKRLIKVLANYVMVVMIIGALLSASAMADDIYGTYQLVEKEFATVSGQKHTTTASVWIKNKDITNPSYKLRVDKNNRSYARIEHDKKLQDKGVMLVGNDSQKQDGRKVLGIYRLDQKDFAQVSGKVHINNVFVWLKTPEISKPEIKLVKSGNKITIVQVDRNQKNQQIQLADKSINQTWSN